MNKTIFVLTLAAMAFTVTCTWSMEQDALLGDGYLGMQHGAVPWSAEHGMRQTADKGRNRADAVCRNVPKQQRLQPPREQWLLL